jgi:DNA-binding XRE family transcriptional regulator
MEHYRQRSGLLMATRRGSYWDMSVVETAKARELFRSGQARKIRERAGISRSEIAEELGVDESTVWRWEGGHRQPSADVATRYARLLRSLDRVAR